MKCFHHNDLDGQCSAAIILSKYPYCETISINYNKDPQPYINSLLSDELVFIVDFSFNSDVMQQFSQKTVIIWIDHHKTILNHPFNRPDIMGIRDVSKSGCELTWKYIYPNKAKMFDIPEAIKLIGDYDTWKLTDPRSKFFHQGLEIYDTEPSSNIWQDLLNLGRNIPEIVEKGKIIQAFIEKFGISKNASYGFKTELEGFSAFALNYYTFGSNLFLDKLDVFDLCISFCFDGINWIVGLYSTKIDVSEIAKKFNGGGHKGAAGFICKELPFKKVEEKIL